MTDVEDLIAGIRDRLQELEQHCLLQDGGPWRDMAERLYKLLPPDIAYTFLSAEEERMLQGAFG